MPGGALACENGTLNISGQWSIDGVLEYAGAFVLPGGASLVGNGYIESTKTEVASGAVLAPGHSIGILHFSGDLQLDAGSLTQIELAENGLCDRLAVQNTLHLGGTLVLQGLNNISPSWGYVFASAAHVEGAYDAVNASALPVSPKRVISSDHWAMIKFERSARPCPDR